MSLLLCSQIQFYDYHKTWWLSHLVGNYQHWSPPWLAVLSLLLLLCNSFNQFIYFPLFFIFLKKPFWSKKMEANHGHFPWISTIVSQFAISKYFCEIYLHWIVQKNVEMRIFWICRRCACASVALSSQFNQKSKQWGNNWSVCTTSLTFLCPNVTLNHIKNRNEKLMKKMSKFAKNIYLVNFMKSFW